MYDQLPLDSRQVNAAVGAMEGPEVRRLLRKLDRLGPVVLRRPETGLVMMNVTDSFDTEFHLGEVVVTTAEVGLGGRRGWGMVMGDDADRAVLLAILDVLSEDIDATLHAEVSAVLRIWHDHALQRAAAEQQMAAATRVQFESMTPEE